MDKDYDKKRDHRYRVVKVMLQANKLESLEEMVKIIPRTIIAKDLHINNNMIEGYIKNPGKFKIDHIMELADLLRYDHKKVYAFITKGIK